MSISATTWVGWLIALAALYGLLILYGYWDTYHPTRFPNGPWEAQASLGAEDVWLTTADEIRIHGWWVPSAEPSEQVTLFLHGNAGNISHRIDHIPALLEVGAPILLIDYRGYGKSGGTPREYGLYADADAAYAYLLERGYKPEQIIVYGQSLGTAVATDLAARVKCAGLVLESPFPSKKAVAHTVVPYVGQIAVWGMNTYRKLPHVDTPVFVMHGDRDRVIRFGLGEQVFAAASEPKRFWRVEGARHPNIVEHAGAEYVRRLREFYADVAAPAR